MSDWVLPLSFFTVFNAFSLLQSQGPYCWKLGKYSGEISLQVCPIFTCCFKSLLLIAGRGRILR